MLDEKRIKEAESNVRQYLEDGLLRKQSNKTAKIMYIENSDLSLQTAQKLMLMESTDYKPYLWVIVTSYYSMCLEIRDFWHAKNCFAIFKHTT